MYQATFQRIKPTLVAVIAGLSINSTAYADSNSAGVSVSATVVEPVEREIKIIDPDSSNAPRWEKAASSSNYIIDYIEPDTTAYDFEHDDFTWLDYVPPTKSGLDTKRAQKLTLFMKI
ncbi:MAG TPA: hypothetical protein VJA18_03250 [Candidatus Nanoarchaeia archaeon]|nr:hypothetical protein [Candidatus Nanoarchaeia archaeon]